MDFLRIFLFAGLAFVGLMLWDGWQKQQYAQAVSQSEAASSSSTQITALDESDEANDVPVGIETNEGIVTQITDNVRVPIDRLVKVTTPNFNIWIDTLGGDIVRAELLKYSQSYLNSAPFVLLEADETREYVAQSGLIGRNGPDARKEGRPQYQPETHNYEIESGTVEVPLVWKDNKGVTVTKTFYFEANNYAVPVKYEITNDSIEPWSGRFYGQIKRDGNADPSQEDSVFGMTTYLGPAYSTQETPYKKYDFGDLQKTNLQEETLGGWVAILQHYFISAWAPQQNQTNHLYTRVIPEAGTKTLYNIGFWSPSLDLAAGQSGEMAATLYLGPKIQTNLEQVAPHLNLTVDYGVLFFISQPLFWVLQKIYDFIGNWGWSIVFLTLLIKLAFYRLSAASYRSMARLRKLQPRILSLKDRYGSDRQAMGRAMMELYKQEKVNPLGGCLPILVQIPVFIALYWVLLESVELRQSPFILWIHDLSARDPYYVLPILMGISMWIQQKLSPTPPDPMQAKVMAMLPMIFTVFFLFFPAGLVLYWVVNNSLSILQQWYIVKKIGA